MSPSLRRSCTSVKVAILRWNHGGFVWCDGQSSPGKNSHAKNILFTFTNTTHFSSAALSRESDHTSWTFRMDFDRSTQAKSWLFDAESLTICRQRATERHEVDVRKPRVKSVRNFASGFHRSADRMQSVPYCSPSLLDEKDQESLVQFHAHQLQTLVGPTALLPELRTSVAVLSTAIILFRRFYLSNSMMYFNARKMATACAYFAAKVEEEKIQVRDHCG